MSLWKSACDDRESDSVVLWEVSTEGWAVSAELYLDSMTGGDFGRAGK